MNILRSKIQCLFFFILCSNLRADIPRLTIDRFGNISFATQVDFQYELLESTNLDDWRTVNNWIGKAGGMVEHKLLFADATHRFYKVIVNPIHSDTNKTLYENGLFVWRVTRTLPDKLKLGCIEAVVIASLIDNGGVGLITHGTLVQENEAWTYESFPENRLVVETNDTNVEFSIQNIQGDFTVTYPFAFLRLPHFIHFKCKDLSSGAFDLDITSTLSPSDGLTVSETFGKLTNVAGNKYNISIVENYRNLNQVNAGGLNYGDTNMGGNSIALNYESEQQLKISATANDFELQINEQRYYRSVYFDHLIENSKRKIQGKWKNSRNSFELDNVNINTALKDTFAVDLETYWLAEGNILLNGNAYAQIIQRRIVTEKGSWQEIYIKSPQGDQVTEVYPLNAGN